MQLQVLATRLVLYMYLWVHVGIEIVSCQINATEWPSINCTEYPAQTYISGEGWTMIIQEGHIGVLKCTMYLEGPFKKLAWKIRADPPDHKNQFELAEVIDEYKDDDCLGPEQGGNCESIEALLQPGENATNVTVRAYVNNTENSEMPEWIDSDLVRIRKHMATDPPPTTLPPIATSTSTLPFIPPPAPISDFLRYGLGPLIGPVVAVVVAAVIIGVCVIMCKYRSRKPVQQDAESGLPLQQQAVPKKEVTQEDFLVENHGN